MADMSPQFEDIIRHSISPKDEHKMTARVLFGRDDSYDGKMPCTTCGEPVDEDVWNEEMGYCVDCQHNAFDHSDEEK